MMLKAIIADDEPLARERLRLLLSDDDEISVAAECRNGRETIDALKRDPYDLLFLDIEMPGTNGLDLVDEVGAAHIPIVVFVTAHHHYAVKAFELNAIDYLTKPVEPQRLKTTLQRVRAKIASQTALLTQEQFKAALASLNGDGAAQREYPKRLLVPNGAKDAFVNVEEIEWVEASDYYSCLHVGARSLMLREPIKQLAERLDPKRFVRVHRSTIVNIRCVREIIRDGRNDSWVLLANGSRLKMSKMGWENLIAATRV